eukprot:COSAG06_NODE_5138_length_3687_cov_4.373467_4_plen_44_part_00
MKVQRNGQKRPKKAKKGQKTVFGVEKRFLALKNGFLVHSAQVK